MNTIELTEEISEILKQVNANRPEYPAVLVDNLGGIREGQGVTASSKDDMFRHPIFSGWKGSVDGISEWEIETFQIMLKDVSAIGYFSFWKKRASKDTMFWVSMPSMRSGEAKLGSAVEIGPERVKVDEILQEELNVMVRQGFEIIEKMIVDAA